MTSTGKNQASLRPGATMDAADDLQPARQVCTTSDEGGRWYETIETVRRL